MLLTCGRRLCSRAIIRARRVSLAPPACQNGRSRPLPEPASSRQSRWVTLTLGSSNVRQALSSATAKPRIHQSRRQAVGRGDQRSVRSLASKASGRTSVNGATPRTVSSRHSGPPFSHRSCRHRPHGIRGSPCLSTHTTATKRPPPLACRAETRPHSAHKARPYDAFSTLQPTTTRPSSTSPAAPTWKFEYGAYA